MTYAVLLKKKMTINHSEEQLNYLIFSIKTVLQYYVLHEEKIKSFLSENYRKERVPQRY